MTDRKITLETAEFLDSPAAQATGVDRKDAREVLQRFLQCAYQGLGKAPHLLDGGDLGAILGQLLPEHFGRRDPLAAAVEPVLRTYLADLGERTLVPHAFELEQALDAGLDGFQVAVERGAATESSQPPPPPIANRGTKVGRNDPCPCGSGRKFKKCCARLGESS